jgi:uncharacterized protein (DUF2141 family)
MTRHEARLRPLLLGLIFACPALAGAAQLDVRVEGVRNDQGKVRVVLYDQDEGFRKEQHSRAIHALPAVTGKVSSVFRDLPPGRYAVIVYHDENGNDKLDLRFGMFPKEGYGLSNDYVPSGPPKFKAAAIEVTSAGAGSVIRLAY